MDFRNDPFFEGASPPSMSLFPHVGLGSNDLMMRRHHDHQRSLVLSPFGHMGMGLMPFGPSPFSMMGGMMQNMDSMMRNMQRGAGGGQCFSSSSTTVMHYSSDGGGGQPHLYHATSSTRQGPGGVKETRKAVKDSHTGLQKMAVGHHIGERSHVVERQVNAKTGERAENQEFVNLDETEADTFGEEWSEKTRPLNQTPSLLHPSLGHSRRNQFAESRGLPSTSRPSNPDGEKEGRGRSNKRRHRPVSLSGEEEEASFPHHTTTTSSTTRSPKLSRTKSPPCMPGPPHSSSQFQTDPSQFHSEATPTANEGTRPHKKKRGKKKTTVADL